MAINPLNIITVDRTAFVIVLQFDAVKGDLLAVDDLRLDLVVPRLLGDFIQGPLHDHVFGFTVDVGDPDGEILEDLALQVEGELVGVLIFQVLLDFQAPGRITRLPSVCPVAVIPLFIYRVQVGNLTGGVSELAPGNIAIIIQVKTVPGN